jgi:hypothetical protein
VHDHAAVGSANEASPSLTPRRENDLTESRTTGKPSESKGKKRRETVGS